MSDSRILIHRNFLSPDQCRSLRDRFDVAGFDNQYAGDGRLLRSRAQFEDASWTNLIWQKLSSSVPLLVNIYDETFAPDPAPKRPLENYRPTALNERFRCYQYVPGQEFRRHQDFAHEYSETKRTFLTLLLYVNDDFEGGETAFDSEVVVPSLGALVLFPHELEHEGREVTAGIKQAMRTDVVYEALD